MENEMQKEYNLVPLHFTMSENQYKKLRILKKEGFCKTMYILRLAAFYIASLQYKDVKSYKDVDFETKTGKHYKVDLPSDLYNKMKTQADLCGFSMSKLMRIGINDTLYFM